MARSEEQPVNLDDYEKAAKTKLSPMAYDYYASGAEDEVTLRENRTAFERVRLWPRVLRGVGPRDLSTTLLGQSLSFPLVIAPAAFQRMAHRDGELAVAGAAKEAGIITTLSTLATTSIEEVCRVGGEVWFQLYVYKDRDITLELLQRAEASGCKALVLTVDAAAWGKREADLRNRFHLLAQYRLGNLMGGGLASGGGSGLADYVDRVFKLDLDWADVERLQNHTKLPIVLKGILHPEDAERAVEMGLKTIWVSNHGGRQLDTAVTALEALPHIARAVDGRAELILDGGVRRGSDILKAIANGAKAAAVARPVLWGLAVGGRDGVGQVLEILRQELDTAMALCGCAAVGEVNSRLLFTTHQAKSDEL